MTVSLQQLERRVAELESELTRVRDRGEIENLFARYIYLHNAFRDEEIIDLWVKEGTPGIHAEYGNVGVYDTYETVTAYHRGRPTPEGKLIMHSISTPVIEVAEDGRTAKVVWILFGTESGLIAKGTATLWPATRARSSLPGRWTERTCGRTGVGRSTASTS